MPSNAPALSSLILPSSWLANSSAGVPMTQMRPPSCAQHSRHADAGRHARAGHQVVAAAVADVGQGVILGQEGNRWPVARCAAGVERRGQAAKGLRDRKPCCARYSAIQALAFSSW